MSHTMVGTKQTIRALGDHFSLLIVEAISASGESFPIQNIRGTILKEDCDFPSHFNDLTFPSESFNNSDNLWLCELIQSPSDQPVFKIGSSTKLILVQAEASPNLSVGFGRSEISKLTPKVNYINSHLFGLDTVRDVILGYLSNFLLTCVHGNDTVFSSNITPGIILYGLPGCGKRTFLENIANDQIHLVSTIGSLYEKPVFITFTSELVTELTNKSSHHNAYRWLTNLVGQLDVSNRNCIPVIILWPNIDKWIDNDENIDTNTHSTADTDVESKMFPKILERFIESIQLVSQSLVHNQNPTYRFCILATATTIDKVFSIHECRELFYRRLLISLPDASKRYQILYHNIQTCLSHGTNFMSSSESSHGSIVNIQSYDITDENESLIQVAARLHGYTPKDLVRLVHVSYASFLSKQNDNSKDFPRTRNFNQSLDSFCEILINESHSYLPINLSQHITSVEPLRWTDIGGYRELKLTFKTMIQDRLVSAAKPNSLDAQADAALRLRVPRGILLHGPPGCSKTMFVRALATECQLPLIAVQASRIFGRYVGDSERNMRRILVHARASAPAILFIDEIDLLLPSRNTGETSASEHVLGEVLMAMDGVEGQNGQVILVAATNRMDNLDSALSRAGRFDLVIEVSPPDADARTDILRLELSKRALKDKSLLNCKWLNLFATNQLNNYTGAEVVQVVQQAAQIARQDNSNQISKKHLLQAQTLLPPRSLLNYFSQRKIINNQVTMSTNNNLLSIRQKTLIFPVLILCIAIIFQLVYINNIFKVI
ncbi:putative aaa family ATPase [Schistosoma mansoni]|nr:putative aaa family ATPase [Schistosoma mansoni]|eukprot:XP_018650139.1 putative aaa family ATPase [Schistosoma mansoni]